MTLHTLTVPDDPAELPRWLERQLVALDFGQFEAELRAHFPPIPGVDPPRNLLDRWLPAALNDGLESLPTGALQQLLKHPALLAALRERIVTDGGEYWDGVMDRADDLSRAVSDGRRSIDRIFSAEGPPAIGIRAEPSERVKRTGGIAYKIWAATSTGIAACLAVALGIEVTREPEKPPVMKAQIAWGWSKPGGLPTDSATARDYLNKLAATAEEWQIDRPGDASNLGVRIAEFRIGCTRLMHSAYGPLVPAEKEWLLERCRSWAKALDEQQQALDAGADTQAVRAAVDETVRTIVKTLRDRADQRG